MDNHRIWIKSIFRVPDSIGTGREYTAKDSD